METAQTVESHFDTLKNLSSADKLELITKLSESVKLEISKRERFRNAFGAFDSSQSAEELAEEIRNSRNSERRIEDL